MLAVTLAYLAVVLTTTVNVFFASLLGNVTTATFTSAVDSPAWPFLMLIATAVVGAGSIADDVGSRAFTLYFSRPIRLLDYLAAKTLACGSWLVIAAVGPGMVAVATTVTLGYESTAVALGAVGGFLAVGLLAAVFFTGLALALSSLTNRALYAGVTIFGLILSVYIGAPVVAAISGNTYVLYANPLTDLLAVAHAAFSVPGSTTTDPGTGASILAGSGVAFWAFAAWRLSRIEVIAE
jgi:ABC-type transport system involved in multi-copper enzyme maturation permease subunit